MVLFYHIKIFNKDSINSLVTLLNHNNSNIKSYAHLQNILTWSFKLSKFDGDFFKKIICFRSLTGRLYPSMSDTERRILRRKKRLIISELNLSTHVLTDLASSGALPSDVVREIRVCIENIIKIQYIYDHTHTHIYIYKYPEQLSISTSFRFEQQYSSRKLP